MHFLDRIGLAGMSSNEDTMQALIAYVISNGQVFTGYRGTYHHKTIGHTELIVHTVPARREGSLEFTGFSSHVSSNDIWPVEISPKGILKEDTDALSRCVFCSPGEDGDDAVPIRLQHFDVLPSTLPGDRLVLQMAAFPTVVGYWPDMASWRRERGRTAPEGMRPGVPVAFGNDDTCRIVGIVQDVRERQSLSGGEEDGAEPFLCVVLATSLGNIGLCHSLKLVWPEQRAFIRAGCVVETTCILSGDAAVAEYQGGAVIDEEHLLLLLRECAAMRDLTRIAPLLASDCVLASATPALRGRTAQGCLAAISKTLDLIGRGMGKGELLPTCLATIAGACDEAAFRQQENAEGRTEGRIPSGFYVGRRCIVVAGRKEHGDVAPMLVLSLDVDAGKICGLRAEDAAGFHLRPGARPGAFPPPDTDEETEKDIAQARRDLAEGRRKDGFWIGFLLSWKEEGYCDEDFLLESILPDATIAITCMQGDSRQETVLAHGPQAVLAHLKVYMHLPSEEKSSVVEDAKGGPVLLVNGGEFHIATDGEGRIARIRVCETPRQAHGREAAAEGGADASPAMVADTGSRIRQ